jgi:hypothetical protein
VSATPAENTAALLELGARLCVALDRNTAALEARQSRPAASQASAPGAGSGSGAVVKFGRDKGKKLDEVADRIIAHVNALKVTEQWTTGFEPAPLTYINQRRWEDETPAEPLFGRRIT